MFPFMEMFHNCNILLKKKGGLALHLLDRARFTAYMDHKLTFYSLEIKLLYMNFSLFKSTNNSIYDISNEFELLLCLIFIINK